MIMEVKRMRVPDFAARKRQGEKIVMLTAYDATMARLLDRAGVDALLVGDSLGTVILGLDTTLPVTLDAVVHHTRAVVRGAERAFVIADMPFLTFQVSVAEAVRNAGRLLQEGGAAAVKLEGGRPVADVVKRLVDVGIPVMGHLGLQPQSVHQAGGYVRQATQPAAVDALMIDALALQDAGAFSLVLESIPADVARTVTRELAIPTIGIGAGPDCDGQILVSYDMLGLFDGFVPSFVHQYAKLGDAIEAATREYASDVRAGRYPQRAKPVTAPHVTAGSSSSGQ
jgi:3-methyl-2-oxobutanoate hydroxymethyltransferase